MSINFLFCLETRPHYTGEWEYEDNIATFQGDVECVLRHPNPRSELRPRRVVIPMIYIMHIPSAYTYRPVPPPPYNNRCNSCGCHGPSSSLSREGVVHEYDSAPCQRHRARSPPRYTPGARYVHMEEEEEEEEDPMEGSTGSDWRFD